MNSGSGQGSLPQVSVCSEHFSGLCSSVLLCWRMILLEKTPTKLLKIDRSINQRQCWDNTCISIEMCIKIYWYQCFLTVNLCQECFTDKFSFYFDYVSLNISGNGCLRRCTFYFVNLLPCYLCLCLFEC